MSPIEDSLSLSTCWCSARHTDGYAMVEEMVGLGFKRIELSHGIRISLVPGILEAVREGMVAITSLHNFCPLPNSVQQAAPNLYQPSAGDERERALWHRYTEQTLDFAVKVGALRVVLHSGSTWFFLGSPEERLKLWVDTSELEPEALATSEVFTKERDRALKKIRRKAERKALPRIREAFEAVLPLAKERGLTLCLENREGLEELPLDEAYASFIEALPEPECVAAWHDTGHAKAKELFGLLEHRSFLETIADRLAGFHLHDVDPSGKDHQVPGTGIVDFEMVSEFVRPEHVLVLELSPRLEPDAVRQSRDYLIETFS